MKSAWKVFIASLAVVGILAVQIQPAYATITLNGTIPSSSRPLVIIQQNNQTGATGVIKFKFSAPKEGLYSMNFCIGPASNPCGLETDYVVTVPGGQSALAIVDAKIFGENVLVVSQGTSEALPFTVEID